MWRELFFQIRQLDILIEYRSVFLEVFFSICLPFYIYSRKFKKNQSRSFVKKKGLLEISDNLSKICEDFFKQIRIN